MTILNVRDANTGDFVEIDLENPSGTVYVPDYNTGEIIPVTMGGGTVPGGTISHAYFSQLCAMLEPDAIEIPRYSTFSYPIAADKTKYLMLAWACAVGGSRLEIRTPLGPPYMLPLRGVTVSGTTSGSSHSSAVFIDPTLPVYTDAFTTYYDRLSAISSLQTHVIPITGQNQNIQFLPGPYGNIVLRITSFNLTWTGLADSYRTGAWPLHMERGDVGSTDYFRYGEPLMIPINKSFVTGVMSGESGGVGGPEGTLLHVILPATWSKVPDPLNYIFREDFMGTALDTSTVWTRSESAVGNVEIDPKFQWCKLKGNGVSWGSNGAYSQTIFDRSSQPTIVTDFCMPTSGNTYGFFIGFGAGTGQGQNDFSHGVLVQQNGNLKVYEDTIDRAEVGLGHVLGEIYRLRIRALSSGAALYEIQGGSVYGPIGGPTWTNITPAGTHSSNNNLHAAFAAAGEGNNYISDIRVY